MSKDAPLAPIRTRAAFWASCRHCGGTIRHDPPHSIVFYDPTGADFRAFYHEQCARDLRRVQTPRTLAPVIPFRR